MHGKLAFLFLVAALAGMSSTAFAMPGQPVDVGGATASDDTAPVIKVANGCGPGGYRGQYGACHAYGTGPFPGGYYGPFRNNWGWNGCPPGFWRGPWGHCRDTPYHGRLPGGGWQ